MKKQSWIKTRTMWAMIFFFFAQPITSFALITFEKTYGGPLDDVGNKSGVYQTSDGGYIITSGTNSFGAGLFDVYLIKTDSLGDTIWTSTYGDSNTNMGYSVLQTSDGGYIITGNTYATPFDEDRDVYIVKTDSNGDTLWTKTYGESGSNEHENGHSIQQTFDGNYIIAGSTNWERDVYLLKIDSLGDTLWTRMFGDAVEEITWSVQQTPDSGYILAGSQVTYGGDNWDVYLIKTDSVGDTLWTKTYDNNIHDLGYSVRLTSDGGYIIVGSSGDWYAQDFFLIKTDSLGDTLWTRTYGGSGEEQGWDVQQLPNGVYILVGYTNSFGAGDFDVYMICTDSLGDTISTRTFGDSLDDRGYGVILTSDGGIAIVGFTESFGEGERDVYLIKTDICSTIVGIEENRIEPSFPQFFSLHQNQPNPFTSSTLIRYTLPGVRDQGSVVSEPIYVNLSVHDITGRLVETLANESLESGVYRVQWDAKGLSSGIYFCSLTVGGLYESNPYTSTRKMILLK